MEIALEDNFEDIIGKAMRGRSLSNAGLAEVSGLSLEAIHALRAGRFDEEALRAVAPRLGLCAKSLVAIALKKWQPKPVDLSGLYQFHNQGTGMNVNSYLIYDQGLDRVVVFDTGEDASEMIRVLIDIDIPLDAIFLTHTHTDHVACLAQLRHRFPDTPVYVGKRETLPDCLGLEGGETMKIGGLTIDTRLTSGHSIGGMSYIVTGLARQVAVVGDALFAGSMGGGMVSWQDALENNRRKIFTLPDSTIICPGHGPMTTVGEEKAHNPFYPELKSLTFPATLNPKQ